MAGGQGERGFFAAHGWVVLRDVVGPDAVEALVETFDRCVGTRPSSVPEHAASGVLQVPAAGRRTPALLAHLAGALAARIAAILGSERLQLLQDALIYKPAGRAGAVAMHQDYTYTGFFTPPNALSARLCLSGGGVDDGCLFVVDGSHVWGVLDDPGSARRDLSAAGGAQAEPRLPPGTDPVRRPLVLAPGDVSLHHCLTLHGSHPNLGPTPCRTIVTHLLDGGCTIDPERLAARSGASSPLDAHGRPSPETFPVLYRAR